MIAWQLAHRRARERAIVAALADGCASPRDLVRRVYDGLAPALKPAAERNVLAHLLSLEEAGTVQCTGRPGGPDASFALR